MKTEGDPQTRGFARGAEDLLIPGRLGCPLTEFAVGKLDVKQRVLEGNDLLSPLAVQGDGKLGHSIFSSSVSRG
jgi:hypothetical protein